MEKKDVPESVPDTPGVYFFMDTEGVVLYIGKATSLRDRVRSYFVSDTAESRGPKILQMLNEAHTVSWRKMNSVLEALVSEAQLIKEYQPPYNTQEKDQKSYNYVVITDEVMPRVFTVRERELYKQGYRGVLGSLSMRYVFGPFPFGSQLREALKILRRIFPFRDKKSTDKHQERFYRELGLAPDMTDEQAQKRYNDTIENLAMFFSGKKDQLIDKLTEDMEQRAREERFEEAAQVRNQIYSLQHIQDMALLKKETKKGGKRIEGYDVAHLAGTSSVGVMVTVIDGEPDKNLYRKFTLRNDKKASDTDALYEIVARRFDHPEWGHPDVLIIDGSTAQKRAAEKALREKGIHIPVLAVTKDERHKPKEIKGRTKLINENKDAVLLANSEAHRFAIEFHKKKRNKGLFGK